MSKCTAAQAVAAMEYYIGYREKASVTYSTYRDKAYFDKNAGSNNYTYAGYKCGVNGQPWCAAQVSTAILDACGNTTDAKSVMRVWPYVNCAQMWDNAPSNMRYYGHYQRWTLGKGDRKTYYPEAGDVIIFTDDCKTRSHTGMVYACDKTYVYTIEGNSGNMCRKRSYKLTDKYIYGWVRPNYATSSDVPATPIEQYGDVISGTYHVLSKGCAGGEVECIQILLNKYINARLTVDGIFGNGTKEAVIKFQTKFWSNPDGICGAKTWAKLLNGGE